MSLYYNFFSFTVSLIILLFAADFFVKYAVILAYRLKLSPLVIGTTIVALGTSLPELFVAISSFFHKVFSLSLGTVIGSNILNIALIFGLSIVFFPLRIGTTKTQKTLILLLSVTLLFILPQKIIMFSSSVHSLILFLTGIISLILQIYWGELGASNEDKTLIKNHEKLKNTPIFTSFLILLLSLVFLLLASEFLVSSSLKIVKLLGVSSEFIGLTILAIGSSLPELITTIAAGIKKEEKLLVGNVLGSNIFNLSIIGGLTLNKGGANGIHNLSLIFLLITTFLFFLILKVFKGKVIPRSTGFFLLFFYLLYLVFLII